MIVLIGGEKGGTGKSTLATNLAVILARAGRDVVLVDTDKQKSAASWADTRATKADLPTVHCMEKTGPVDQALLDLAKRYTHVIVDAGGRDSKELRSAMVAADKIYVPIKASQFDLWTVSTMNETIGLARSLNTRLEAYAVISMAPTNPRIGEANEAREMLGDFDQLKLANTIIRERKAYRDAIVEGKGVVEMENDKAAEELNALAQEIYSESLQ